MKFPFKFGSTKKKEAEDEDLDAGVEADSEAVDVAEARSPQDDGPSAENEAPPAQDAEGGADSVDPDSDGEEEGEHAPIPDFLEEDFDDISPDLGPLARLKAWLRAGGTKRRALAIAVAVIFFAALGSGGWYVLSSSPQGDAGQVGASPHGVVINLDTVLSRNGGQKAAPQGASAPSATPQKREQSPEASMSSSAPTASSAADSPSPFQAAPPQGPGAGMIVPPVTAESYRGIASYSGPVTALSSAPDPALVAQGESGVLPVIGPDGRTPFAVYARPYKSAQQERVALVVTGLGLDRAATEAAIRILPPQVSLAFSIYGQGLDYWIQKAREAGHEALLELPMESKAFPVEDPGPHGLLTENAPQENIKQLHYALSRASGYIGVIATMGSRFTAHEDVLKPIFAELKARGLMYVDGGDPDSQGARVAAQMGVAWARIDITLDNDPSAAAIGMKLTELEGIARKRMLGAATLQTYPVTLRQVAAWAATLAGKKLDLAPISALADKQFLR